MPSAEAAAYNVSRRASSCAATSLGLRAVYLSPRSPSRKRCHNSDANTARRFSGGRQPMVRITSRIAATPRPPPPRAFRGGPPPDGPPPPPHPPPAPAEPAAAQQLVGGAAHEVHRLIGLGALGRLAIFARRLEAASRQRQRLAARAQQL